MPSNPDYHKHIYYVVLFMIKMKINIFNFSKIDTFKKLRILIIVIFILFSYIIPLIAGFANETENLDNTVTHLNSTNVATVNNIGAGNLTITLKTSNQHEIIIMIIGGLLGILGALSAAILTQWLHYRHTIELQKRERFGNKQLEAYQSLWKVLSGIESKFGISGEKCNNVDSLGGLSYDVDNARKKLSAVFDDGLHFYYPKDTLALIKQLQGILGSTQAKTVKDLCECVNELKKELEKERIK